MTARETLQANAEVWAAFYRDGKNLGEIAAEHGAAVYDLSPWLTAPLIRAVVSARCGEDVELLPEGWRVLAPGEIDKETVEKCERAVSKASERMPGIETPLMGGDNLAVMLCTVFDDGDRETEDDSGWSQAARDGYDETTKAIREHYAAALRPLREQTP